MKHAVIRFSSVAFPLTLLLAEVVTAQSARPRNDIPAIAKAANGAIVSIITSNKDGKPVAQGTGFLVSTDGRIVTNYHVVKGASSAIVKLPDGAFYDVDGVVAFDKARDLAVIKAHGQNFRVVTLGNSDRVQVGEEIVAIGSPLSLESTVSSGIVSGIRTIEEEGGKFLQVTAPISPGSSGGPLFNMAGQVVGVTTLYLKGGENLNFAIPINDAKRLLLAESTKTQTLPNEPEPVEAQTPEAAKALNWISGHMLTRTYTVPNSNVDGATIQVWETSSLSFQGCRATVYHTSIYSNTNESLESTTTWGPFDLSNLRPDGISRPIGSFLQIAAVNAIPVVTSQKDHTSTEMLGWLRIPFGSPDSADRQAKAWHDAIVGCGGKPIPELHE